MKEDSVEYFYGTKEEINNERLRKLDLMSNFPKTLGTVDRTNYVLISDNDLQQESLHNNNTAATSSVAFSSAVISNNGERAKEWRDKQISWMPGFENRKNSLNFDKGKEDVVFLNQKNDNGTENAQKRPLGLVNNKNTNRNPFAQNFKLQGLDTLNNSLKPNRAKNDSLNLSKNNSCSDFTWKANDKSNSNINHNRASSTKNTLRICGKLRTNEFAEQVNDLKKNLPIKTLDILNQLGVNIEVIDNLYTINNKGEYKKRKGIYAAKNNCIIIDSKHVDEYTLISEVFHAAQDHLGMTGSGKSNLEFQEHVIKDLYFNQRYRKTGKYEYIKGISTTDDNEYIRLIGTVFDENNVLDLKKFLSVIESYFEEFQKYYSPSGMYQEPGIEYFDYNWIELFDLFGIEYKSLVSHKN